jgi:hypothetical protein
MVFLIAGRMISLFDLAARSGKVRESCDALTYSVIRTWAQYILLYTQVCVRKDPSRQKNSGRGWRWVVHYYATGVTLFVDPWVSLVAIVCFSGLCAMHWTRVALDFDSHALSVQIVEDFFRRHAIRHAVLRSLPLE